MTTQRSEGGRYTPPKVLGCGYSGACFGFMSADKGYCCSGKDRQGNPFQEYSPLGTKRTGKVYSCNADCLHRHQPKPNPISSIFWNALNAMAKERGM